MEITLRYNTFEFVKLATEYFCASTFVREGISSPSHSYDGSILKACSQCKHTHYKDTAAQKSAWKFHKQNYKKSTPSNINYINKLNLSQTTDEAKMVLFKPKSSDDVSHCLFYLLRRIRKALMKGTVGIIVLMPNSNCTPDVRHSPSPPHHPFT